MKKDLTELVFVLDQSGSMHGLEEDTIGGFNSMIHKQRRQEGEAYVSTVLFNTRTTVLHDRVSLDCVEPMTYHEYVTGGGTALLDALGSAIHHIGNVHKYARKEDVPEHTLFVVITDGMENASREYSRQRVKEMIERQKSKHGWEFLFFGANIDAEKTAQSYGITPSMAVTYKCDREGTALNYEVLSEAIHAVRVGSGVDANWKKRIDEDCKARGKR